MQCSTITFSGHAVQRMFTRALQPADVIAIVGSGEVIEDYRGDFPYPSCLLLGWVASSPVHVVAARETVSETCVVVTVYSPDPARWSADFRTRRQP